MTLATGGSTSNGLLCSEVVPLELPLSFVIETRERYLCCIRLQTVQNILLLIQRIHDRQRAQETSARACGELRNTELRLGSLDRVDVPDSGCGPTRPENAEPNASFDEQAGLWRKQPGAHFDE